MTKMTEVQRNAVLRAHRDRTSYNLIGVIYAAPRTLRVIHANRWAQGFDNQPTRAGLLAAGINMDKLRDKALTEWIVRDDDPRDDAVRAEAKRWRMRGGRGDGLLWAADICREAAHREAVAVCAGLTEAQTDHFVTAECGRRDAHGGHGPR